MKRIALALALLLGLAGPLAAQEGTNPGAGVGGTPVGAAGGDLGGTYPNPTVTGGTHITGVSLTTGVAGVLPQANGGTAATSVGAEFSVVSNVFHIAAGGVTNAMLANAATTVNGQTCTLGSTCTVTGAPSGSAGGDLSGTYPNPTVASAGGKALSLGGAITTAAALSTTGAGAATLAFPASPATFTFPGASQTLASLAGTETLTNKTLTAPIFGGTITGTYTLGGTPSLAAAAITSPPGSAGNVIYNSGGTALGGAGGLTYSSSTPAGSANPGQVIIGGAFASSAAAFVVNANAVTTAIETSNLTMQLAAKDGQAATIRTYSNSTGGRISGVLFGGTLASPTATPANGFLLEFDGSGYDATNGISTVGGAQILAATALWTPTSHPTEWIWNVTPTGSITAGFALELLPDGGLSISTNLSDPGANGLYVAGQIVAPNITQSAAAQTGTVCFKSTGLTYDATLACLTSAETLKDDIKPLPNGLSTVMALQPILYQWKPDAPRHDVDPGIHPGLGAYATAYVNENLIARDDKGNPRGWRQDAVIAELVAAIQEQQREIDALRNEHR